VGEERVKIDFGTGKLLVQIGEEEVVRTETEKVPVFDDKGGRVFDENGDPVFEE
jgi:hypothetical protein